MTPAPSPAPPPNFLLRFWRGQYALWISFWLFGIGLYGVGVAAILALTAFVYDGVYEPRTIALSLYAMWAVAAIVALFAFVGIWRAAANGRAAASLDTVSIRPLRDQWRAFWSALALLAALGGIVLIGVRFVQVGIPQVDAAWRMAFEDDPDVPGYTMRIMRDGQEMEIAGGFKFGLTRDARAMMDTAPNLKVLHLASIGGRIGEARELAQLIVERGLVTYTATQCLSACTIAFIAGRDRFLKTEGRLGFHRASFAGQDNAVAMRDLLLAAGIERPFVDRVSAQAASGMWYPSRGELEASHVITAMTDGRRFAASGLGAEPTVSAFARDLRNLAVYRSFEQVEPRLFKSLVEEYERRYLAGQSEGEIQDQLSLMVGPRLREHIASADNAVLIDYANLMADQYAAIGAKDVTACFRRITRGATPGDEALFSQELRDREQALQQRAIRASIPRTPAPPELLQANFAVVFKQLRDRYSEADLQIFGRADKVAPNQYATYCRLGTAIFRGIAALPPSRAGDVMSAQFRSAIKAPPAK
jgi:hypothetical protein